MQKTTYPVFEHKQQEPSQETGLHNSPSPTTTTANDHSPSSCQQPAAWLQADMVMLSTPPLLNCQLQRPLWQALRCSHSNTEGHLPCLGRGLGAIFTEIFYFGCTVTFIPDVMVFHLGTSSSIFYESFFCLIPPPPPPPHPSRLPVKMPKLACSFGMLLQISWGWGRRGVLCFV